MRWDTWKMLPGPHSCLRSMLLWDPCSFDHWGCSSVTSLHRLTVAEGNLLCPFSTGATIDIFFWEGSHPSVFSHFFSWGFFFFIQTPQELLISLSLSLCSQCWINILYWEIDHRALGYRCLIRAPTPVSNGDGRGTVKPESIKSTSRAFVRASSDTFPNSQKHQQCKLLEVVSLKLRPGKLWGRRQWGKELSPGVKRRWNAFNRV